MVLSPCIANLLDLLRAWLSGKCSIQTTSVAARSSCYGHHSVLAKRCDTDTSRLRKDGIPIEFSSIL